MYNYRLTKPINRLNISAAAAEQQTLTYLLRKIEQDIQTKRTQKIATLSAPEALVAVRTAAVATRKLAEKIRSLVELLTAQDFDLTMDELSIASDLKRQM